METARPARSIHPAPPPDPASPPDPAPTGRGRKRARRGSLLVVGAGVLTLAASEPAADYVYLGRTVTASQRARQLRALTPPPPEWTAIAFDDASWTAAPVTVQPPSAAPTKATTAGALWQTAAPPSVTAAPPPEPVLIFADDVAVPARSPPAAAAAPTPTPAPAAPAPKSASGKGRHPAP